MTFGHKSEPSRKSFTPSKKLIQTYSSLPSYSETFLKIQLDDERRSVVPLRFNEEQWRFHEIKGTVRDEGKRPRFLIVKPRKQGFSTYEQATSFWLCSLGRGYNAVTMTDIDDNRAKIFSIAHRFIKHGAPACSPAVDASASIIRFPDRSSIF